MSVLFIIIICTSVISLLVVGIIRNRLKAKNESLSERIAKSSCERAKENALNANDSSFIDISTEIHKTFRGEIIPQIKQRELADHYSPCFKEAHSLVKKLEMFGLAPSEAITRFMHDYGDIDKLVKNHNDGVVNGLLDTHQTFFDHCLKYPLDKQQRRSIVSEEDNCLVVSSAGSGKTSSIVGKVKYLTEIKGIAPERILLISYTNKAASELTERMNTKGLKGYTFHKLALDIIAETTGVKPSVCDNTDALFVNIYRNLLEKPKFKKSVIQYFVDYQTEESDWMHEEGKSVKYIASKMGRSQTSIVMRLGKLKQ